MILIPLLEGISIMSAFWLSYAFRWFTDGIPFVQLRIPYISHEQFIPFIIAGVCIWWIVFARAKLYSTAIDTPLFEEIRKILLYSFLWFFIYIGFVYMTTGFLFSKEIPRLIIIYTYILSTLFSILIRVWVYTVWSILYKKDFLKKKKILVLTSHINDPSNLIIPTIHPACEYTCMSLQENHAIESIIRTKNTDAILLLKGTYTDPVTKPLLDLAGIYGIPCTYPQIQPYTEHFSQRALFLWGIPVIQLNTVSITLWQRIIKRTIDIIFSFVFLILTLPLILIIYIGIKIEDPSGPVIFRNRRIGKDGTIFTLYKFRYMYWKYCVKEEYIPEWSEDAGLILEEKLKAEQNTREGPLYKIANDPRKMKFWSFIEKLSLDELPQLFNVLIGNMSLIGPRPHQPREVDLYDESDKQVLTIKPGITGMAQVYGRDKNTFKEEIALDIYYIENYSVSRDIAILLRTILVVLRRPFE